MADDIVASKKGMDPQGRGVWWKVHPDQPKSKAGPQTFPEVQAQFELGGLVLTCSSTYDLNLNRCN